MSDEHSSFIKTPKQLAIVVVVAFAVPIILVGLLSQLVTGVKPPGKMESDPQLASRIKPVGEVTIADASAPKGNLTGEQVFQQVCKTCHEPGIAGAPKVGDKAAWAVPIKKGYETLVQHAIGGFQEAGKVMPPKGGNPDLADVEVERAVVFMANRSGANFKEPPAPAAAASTAAAPATPPAAPAVAGAAGGAAPTAAAAAPDASAKTAGPLDSAAAQAMMQKDGCGACHAVDKKIVGPAYHDVAAKYKGDSGALSKLTQKVKTGGSGVWGSVPMPPNSHVPDGDINALVSWILALK
jgi:cytochrome c551/c552/cytochrome c5